MILAEGRLPANEAKRALEDRCFFESSVIGFFTCVDIRAVAIQFRPMDTMKILLGATIALLLGALAVSWQGMKAGVRNTPHDEIARLEKQLNELRAEQQKMQSEKQAQQLKSEPVVAAVEELDAMKLEIEQKRIELEELELQKARDLKVAQDEEGLLEQRKLENTDSELRRARRISEALLIGKVVEYIEEPEYGGFVTLQVLMPEQVQVGTILAIRRKTGILGQLKVSDVTPDGAIANPLPGFGSVQPTRGDELILPPQY